jgi:very-short-patch-repair endonuclease
MHRELSAAFAELGLISRRAHPELAGALRRARSAGQVVAVLPGVYAPASVAGSWRVRARAACQWDPDAIVIGDAAAALTFWPELTPRVVTVAARRTLVTRPGFAFTQRVVPAELVREWGGLRVTVPAFTAIDLATERGGDAIDRVLRSRMTTLRGLYEALDLTGSRRGNHDRRLLLLDSKDEPWSAAERLAHRIFRGAGIRGWRANAPFRFEDRNYFLDMDFKGKPLVIEIDGRIHDREDVFETDRIRGNDLVLAGRWALHYTWRMLNDDPHMVIRTTIRALAQW